jgi:hypothetical protein
MRRSYLLSILVTLALIVAVESIVLVNNKKAITTLEEQVEDNFNRINYNSIKHENTISELEKIKFEYVKVKRTLEEIQNEDEKLKKAILMYIDRKYRGVPKKTAMDISTHVVELSRQEDIFPELVLGVIEVESSFNPMAVSNKDARGLMQVMPEWAPKFKLRKVSELHKIDKNILCGIKVLKIHIKQGKGNISKGLYYYVGKDDTYSGRVYEAIGHFTAFKMQNTINNSIVLSER